MAKQGRTVARMAKVTEVSARDALGKGVKVRFDTNHRRAGEALSRLGAMTGSALIVDDVTENKTAFVRNPINNRTVEVPVTSLVTFD